MGLDQITRHNERHGDEWHYHRTISSRTRLICQICREGFKVGAELWITKTGSGRCGDVAHQRCAQQTNRRAAASEAI